MFFFYVGADEVNGGVGRLSVFFPCDNLFVGLWRFSIYYNVFKKIFVNRTRSLRPYLQCVRDKFLDLMCSWHKKSVWVNFLFFPVTHQKIPVSVHAFSPKCLTLLVNFKNKTFWIIRAFYHPLSTKTHMCVFTKKVTYLRIYNGVLEMHCRRHDFLQIPSFITSIKPNLP